MLDKFHVFRRLSQVLKYRKSNSEKALVLQKIENLLGHNLYESTKKWLENSKVDNVIMLLQWIKTTFKSELNSKLRMDFSSLIKYLKYNNYAIQNWKSKLYIGSKTETYVNHLLKKLVKCPFGSYSRQVFNNMIVRNSKTYTLII
ncbi:hypothetical protein [Mycoplasmopsis agassizii]|uniref:Transposase IS204/IS1001/IS1096/IS1165 DDE domain-containing protein n=1 Tax=Mycoplasmopsis agassizii TaxID=33922 RepID=A0ABX4H665_9BACT|nr:hypothetical protein [Mycoplasmopsis agassizii]PAF55361.1 hypothetical protein CJF60_01575 [Mycoplasmopsis agassizii]SMC20647.1 hypothetical protein SAMN02745179_01037 [Mycoplasmopsis agassizii]